MRLTLIPLTLVMFSCVKKDEKSEATTMIAYGSEVKTDEAVARATVALVEPSLSPGQEWFPYCSGTLIDRSIVVTAAHCVVGREEVQLLFGLGTLSKPLMGQGTFIAHPSYGAEYNESLTFDIALIKLGQPAPAPMQAVAIASLGEYKVGDEVLLAGYGDVVDPKYGQTQINPGKLYKAGSKIIDIFNPGDEDIREDYENWGLISYKSDNGKSGACSGDSGGPMFIVRQGTLKVIGATAGGYGSCGAQGMYTHLNFYETWIKETREALSR